jgi:glycerate dehydrogenase
MDKMKIVVIDGYTLNPGDNPWDEVAVLGDLVIYDRSNPEQILERTKGTQIVVVNKTAMQAEILAQLPQLRFIAVSATGYDCVDVKAAGCQGIPVSNVPVYGTDSVAQHVMALLLELCKRVGLHDQAVKSSEWMAAPDWSFWKTPLNELTGKTMGIVGFGRIGRRVGELAHAFGMKVLAYDPFESQEPPYEPFSWAKLDELFSDSDVITLHTPLTPDLEGIVNADLLGSVKPGALFINASRGGLVEEKDLAEALNSGKLGGAALDVVSLEPIRQDNPLLKAKNVFITPHIAWATLEARRRLLQKTAENIRAFVGGASINVVNASYLKSVVRPHTLSCGTTETAR